MARRHKGKHAVMQAIGLCKYYETPQARGETFPTGPRIGLDVNVPAQADGPIPVASLLKDQMALQEKGFLANGIANFTKDIIGSIFSGWMISIQQDAMTKALQLQTDIETHNDHLKNKMVDGQAALANKIEDNKVVIARLQSREKRDIAQIEADAKVRMASKRETLRLFYPTGSPTAPLAVG